VCDGRVDDVPEASLHRRSCRSKEYSCRIPIGRTWRGRGCDFHDNSRELPPKWACSDDSLPTQRLAFSATRGRSKNCLDGPPFYSHRGLASGSDGNPSTMCPPPARTWTPQVTPRHNGSFSLSGGTYVGHNSKVRRCSTRARRRIRV